MHIIADMLCGSNASYYQKGVTDVASGAVTKDIYHAHLGNVDASTAKTDNAVYSKSSPGGCYNGAGHTHNAGGVSCPVKTGYKWVPCGGGISCTLGPYEPDSSGNVYYVGDCPKCGYQGTTHGSPGWVSCPNGTSSPYDYYDCNNNNVDDGGGATNTWKPSACGLSSKTVIASFWEDKDRVSYK